MTPAELAQRRMALGLSPAELARVLGIDRHTVNRWEDGRRAIPPYLALAMCAIEQGARTDTDPRAPIPLHAVKSHRRGAHA